MHTSGQSRLLVRAVSTSSDDDVGQATDDVGIVAVGAVARRRIDLRTMGRGVAFGLPLRRATTLNPARSNMPSVPWKALADGIRAPSAMSTG